MPAWLHSIGSCHFYGAAVRGTSRLARTRFGDRSGVCAMRRRHRQLAAAACCIGAIGVMATVLLPGQGAGADQGDQGGSPSKTHSHGHSSAHPGGWASTSASASATTSTRAVARTSATAHGATPASAAQPTAQPSAPTAAAPNSVAAALPAAHTTITLQGVRSVPPASHPVDQVDSPPAQIVEVAAASRPTDGSVALAATSSGLLIALAIMVLAWGYRPGHRHGRHRSD